MRAGVLAARAWLCVVGWIGVGACAPEIPRCVPGTAVECTCGAGRAGTQSCTSEGTFGSCSCMRCDGGECACTPGDTRSCTCLTGEAGVERCDAFGWGTCECLSMLVEGCESCGDCASTPTPFEGPVVNGELVRTTSRLITVVPSSRGILIALTRTSTGAYELLRFSLTNGAPPEIVTLPHEHAILAVVERSDRVELFVDDHIRWLDPDTLLEVARHELETVPGLIGTHRCEPLAGCDLWVCQAGDMRGEPARVWITYDSEGHVRAVRRDAPVERVHVPGRLAVIADGWVRFDPNGLARPRIVGFDAAQVEGAVVVGNPGRSLVTLAGGVFDLTGCPDDPSVDADCLGAPGRLDVGAEMIALGARGERLVALTSAGELVEVDLPTRDLRRRPAPEGAVAVVIDPWTRALVVTVLDCSGDRCARRVVVLPREP